MFIISIVSFLSPYLIIQLLRIFLLLKVPEILGCRSSNTQALAYKSIESKPWTKVQCNTCFFLCFDLQACWAVIKIYITLPLFLISFCLLCKIFTRFWWGGLFKVTYKYIVFWRFSIGGIWEVVKGWNGFVYLNPCFVCWVLSWFGILYTVPLYHPHSFPRIFLSPLLQLSFTSRFHFFFFFYKSLSSPRSLFCFSFLLFRFYLCMIG